MTRAFASFETTVRKTREWVGDVAHELGGDAADGYRALRAVLQTLRDWLTPAELADFSAQLPLLVRGVLFEGWRPATTAPRERSLAGFLRQVAARYDGREPRRMVRAVLAVVARRVSAGEVDDMRRVLPRALDELWPQRGPAVLLEPAPAATPEAPRLEELMTREVLTASSEAMLLEALARMERAHVRHLVVVAPKAAGRRGPIPVEAVAGMLTTRDAVSHLRRHPHEATRLDELVVRDVMTPGPLHTARAQATVASAAALMRRERVSALPILDAAGSLVGLVTADDLLGALELAPTA